MEVEAEAEAEAEVEAKREVGANCEEVQYICIVKQRSVEQILTYLFSSG